MVAQKKALSASEAEAILRAGKPLVNSHVEETLDLSGTFSEKVQILNCRVNEIQANGCVFGSDVQLLDVKISGPVSFVNSEFSGKCDLAELDFQYVDFSGAKFKSAAKFKHAQFLQFSDFSAVVFEGRVDFSNATFRHGADFCEAEFKGESNFEFSNFNKTVSFNEAIFQRVADFDRCKIHRHADFRGASFNGPVEFRKASVSEGVHFNHAKFEDHCYFSNSTFSVFNCLHSKISGPFNFSGVRVLKSAGFNGVIFKKKASFPKATFRNRADFSDVKFSEQADFQDTEFLGTVCLLATFTKGSLIRWQQIKDKIEHSLKENHADAREEFIRLKKIFDDNNDYDSMDHAYEMFRHHRNMEDSKPIVFKWVNNLLLKQCSGYGTRPFRFLSVVLGIIFVFAFFFSFHVDQFNPPPDGAFGFFFFFSLTTFIAGGVEGVHPNFDGWLKHVVAFESFSGILLMTFLIVMLARKFWHRAE